MKAINTFSLIGAIALAMPAAAEEPNANIVDGINSSSNNHDAEGVASADLNNPLLIQVTQKISADPSAAAEVVKQAIIQSKADADTVIQIVAAAVTAAPESAESIRKVAVALAPDAASDVKMVISAVLSGDQVAAFSFRRGRGRSASMEPSGASPQSNAVWLSPRAAFASPGFARVVAARIVARVLSVISGNSPGGGGGSVSIGPITIIIRPPVTTIIKPIRP